ncbi:HAMP domain-containing protein [Chloroflexota bacterium]
MKWNSAFNSNSIIQKIGNVLLSVPVRIKIAGIIALPVLILGTVLNYWVRTGLSDWLSRILEEERVRIAMEAGSRSVILVTALATLVSLLLSVVMILILTKPLIELSDVARSVAAGNTKSRARILSSDEIGDVALSVNAMIDHMVNGQEILERKNRQLEALNKVAMAVSQEQDIENVLSSILESILETFGVGSGWIYFYDPDLDQFRLASFGGVSEILREQLDSNPNNSGLCKCQRKLINGELSSDSQCLICERMEVAADYSFGTEHISVGLEMGEQKLGVINLVVDKNHSILEEDNELLKTISAQVSEVVANAWLQSKLLEQEAARQSLLEALVRAEEDERAKLARRLHDDAGQTLTSLLIRMKMLENSSSSEEYSQEVAKICSSFSQTIEKIQGIAYQLRSAILEEFGIEVALRALSKEMLEAAGIEVALDIQARSSENRLPFEVETCLYRIAQESMVNIVRHSEAEKVDIGLMIDPAIVVYRVKDNGIGFDTANAMDSDSYGILGLRSMQERVNMMKGRWNLETAPGEGVLIEVQLPLMTEIVR